MRLDGHRSNTYNRAMAALLLALRAQFGLGRLLQALFLAVKLDEQPFEYPGLKLRQVMR